MEFWSYSYKTVEEPFTMRQTMTKYHPNHSEGVILLAVDQSRHGSRQKPWRGPKISAGDHFPRKNWSRDKNSMENWFMSGRKFSAGD